MNVTIKVDYKFYEPNAGFEEIQAKLFNDTTKKYDEPPTTAERIRTRREAPDFDPKTARYAFDENNNPLAYTQATIGRNNIFISYPWAVKDCPPEVQGKLFDEMVEYIKSKDLKKPVVIGREKAWTEVKEFIDARKYPEGNKIIQYAFKIDDLAKIEVPQYEKRLAEVTDLQDLLALMKKEPSFEGFFESDEAAGEFFKGVIERGNTYLIYDSGELISAGATTGNITDVGISLQMTVTDVKKMDGWKALLVELGRTYQEKGYGDKRLIITPDLEPEQRKFYEDNNAEIWSHYTNYNIL